METYFHGFLPWSNWQSQPEGWTQVHNWLRHSFNRYVLSATTLDTGAEQGQTRSVCVCPPGAGNKHKGNVTVYKQVLHLEKNKGEDGWMGSKKMVLLLNIWWWGKATESRGNEEGRYRANWRADSQERKQLAQCPEAGVHLVCSPRSVGCYGLNCVPPKFICWCPSPQYLRMWLYWKIKDFKGATKLKWGH